MADFDLQEFIDRYVAVWNEPDAKLRRNAIRELWSEDAIHVLGAPPEIQEAAERIGFVSTTLQARGHDELEARVTRAYEEFVAPGTYRFRSRPDAARLHNVVKFTWEMATGSGEVAGVGLEIFILGADGRIDSEYQFIER